TTPTSPARRSPTASATRRRSVPFGPAKRAEGRAAGGRPRRNPDRPIRFPSPGYRREIVMTIERVQNLVIGSGVAGKILAWTLAKQGQKTVVVERSMVGGSCPNVACLPSKNVIYSAKAVSLVHPTAGLGVVTGWVRVNMAAVARRKRQMVDGLRELHLDRFKASGAGLAVG